MPHRVARKFFSCLSRVPAAFMALAAAPALAEPVVVAPPVEVVGTAPLPGVGLARDKVPANVQTGSATAIGQRQPLDLADFLEGSLASINVNDTQGNAEQQTLSFRGFTASPLLGTPQGLSVFQDGARLNEAFGDTVNWDLVPLPAIAGVTLIPGSNPVYGFNTLGGALVLQTKNGRDYPGTFFSSAAGSHGRFENTLESGGGHRQWDYFAMARAVDDDGWREHSDSALRQFFGKLGYRGANSDLALGWTHADNRLHGTQGLPASALDSPERPYTWPDWIDNRLDQFTVNATRYLSDTAQLAANLYLRHLDATVFNSNLEGDFDSSQPIGPGNFPAGNILARQDQHSRGGTLQWTSLAPLARRDNLITLGASLDDGDTTFTQDRQDAIVSGRETVGQGGFARFTDLGAGNRYYGVFASDTWSASRKLDLTLSGRYNQASVELNDRSGANPALDGRHRYQRFNPAAGISYHFRSALTGYVSYSEGMRVPTPVELACADPAQPCSLPTGFLADPALDPIVSHTVETGLQAQQGDTHWSLALYRSDLDGDIQFISSGSSALGYFANVGATRREGVETTYAQQWRRLSLVSALSLLRARYETPFTVLSEANSSADANGNIRVRPGDRIPGLSDATFKLQLDYRLTPRFSAGAKLEAIASQYAFGDQNNTDAHGQVPGYAIVGLRARYRVNARLEFVGRVDNVFDRRYESFGLLGENYFASGSYDPDNTRSEPFLTPGAPRSFMIGLRFALAGKLAKSESSADANAGS